jgi:hypothetical protein
MPAALKPIEYYPHHVLDFLLDDEDSAALTVYTEDNVRMHIIADASRFEKSTKGTKGRTCDEFKRLVATIRKSGDEEDSQSPDSGVGMDTPGNTTADKEGSGVDCVEDAEEALQSWMLEPVRRQVTKKKKKHQQPSLQQYFEAETQFFELDISKKDELCVVELEASSELKRRIAKLKPEITLPKYIRDIKVPWFDSRKLTVLAGSASPPPYHPTQVRCEETGETLFFKAVDSLAPQTTKRELWHLNRIAQPDIVDKIRAPRLVGFVADSTSKTRAIGFLQQDIPDPTPLTCCISSGPQHKRDAWASEAEAIKNTLHDHDLIWGDAKADNFLVDKHDKLWIIDFGGSWTEGWIDPEIKETVQGDDMAMEKITNALHDPVANVEGGTNDEAESPRGSKVHEPTQGVKRKASEPAPENSEDDNQDEESHQHQHRNGDSKKHKPAEEEQEEEDEEEEGEVAHEESPPSEDEEEPEVVPTPPKRRKSKQIENQAAERYCYCDSPSAGPMVGCDNPDCERQWFHFYCAGLKRSPPEDVPWFCRDCTE